jgi:hypothetical protein
MSDIVEMLRLRACSVEEQPDHDHGHSDCYLEREAADEIEDLRAEAHKLAALLMSEYTWVHESKIAEVDSALESYIGKETLWEVTDRNQSQESAL